jgi:hypothetical protein
MNKPTTISKSNMEAVLSLLPFVDQPWVNYSVVKPEGKIIIKVKLLVSESVYDLHLNNASEIYKFQTCRRWFAMNRIIDFSELLQAYDVVDYLKNKIQLKIDIYKDQLLQERMCMHSKNVLRLNALLND